MWNVINYLYNKYRSNNENTFMEGNEFLQRYVICLKSIELNKQKVSELEKGGKNSLKKF